MRIVLFTRVGFQSDELFLYLFARVVEVFSDVRVVAVSPQRTTMRALWSLVSRYWKKIQRLGLLNALEIITSYPLQIVFISWDHRRTQRLLQQLPRHAATCDGDRVVYVKTVNGADAIQAMAALEPDIIIQAGAGILRARLVKTARLGAVNLHHGIAPLVRGMNSIYWALWENRPDWLGSTVHWIDEDIDTGEVLAYAPIRPTCGGGDYPAIFAQATQSGLDQLVATLRRLQAGDTRILLPPTRTSVYRSTMSGWRLLILRVRLALRRAIYFAGKHL